MSIVREYFENKKVALVGPADYLELISPGNLTAIEACDVVIKINCGFNLTKSYENVLGKRTDFLYNTLLDNCINGGVIDVEEISRSDIKHIRTIPKSNMKGIAVNNNISFNKQRTMDKILELQNNHNIELSIIDYKFFNNISRQVDCRPTTGFAAMLDILSHEPELLYVTGFSFFLSGPLKGYWGGSEPNGIEALRGRTEVEEAERAFNSTRHVHKNMWRYAKEKISTLKNIRFDPILEEIIKLKEYSKEGYNEILKENYGVSRTS